MMLLTLPLLLLVETSLATCKYKFIHNASEFVQFSNDVNSGTTYSGYTVYLVADIIFNQELSQQFSPIGYYDSTNPSDYYEFLGTFDGQGYSISNLTKSSSSLQHLGLFGYSTGTTIKNVVIDNTCSFESTFPTSLYVPRIGGIIVWCSIKNGPCVLENNVNMANLSYSAKSYKFILIGGIVGKFDVPNTDYDRKVINCVNYGAIYNSGNCDEKIIVGGIIGLMYPTVNSYKNYVYNCLNHGTIKNVGTTDTYCIGGIVGESYGISINNCLNTGSISSSKGSVGGIIGYGHTYISYVTRTYWTNPTSYYGKSSDTYSPSGQSRIETLSSTYVSKLNNYVTADNGWNEWIFNENRDEINFTLHDKNKIVYSSSFIIVPEPARRGYSFQFWCVNENSIDECNNKYDYSKLTDFTAATTFYAQWIVTNCTVKFDVNEGYDLFENERNRTITFDQNIGELPEATRRGYTFTGWFTMTGELISSKSLVNNACNCTLYAHWTPNNYTVTLDVNRGNELANNTKNVTFDDVYGELPTTSRDGFDFIGWYTKDGKNITKDTVVSITSTQTLYANWSSKKYTVTLDVNGGDELSSSKREVEVLADKAYDSLTIPTRKGYTFAGWYTEDGGLITDDTTTAIITRDQTIHAEWTPNNYTVSFDVNGGYELPEDRRDMNVTFNTTYKTLPSPTRVGYTFAGWLTEDMAEVVGNDAIVFIIRDQTFHASWTANNYTVSFDVNGGEELSNVTVTFHANYSCLPTPTREGYEFLWWYIKDTNEKVDNETAVNTTYNHTLCAAWNKNTVTFDVNGGEELLDNEKEKEVTYDDTYKTLPAPSRNGYSFDGWFTDDNKIITSDTKVEIVSDQTLHAKWTPNNYTMTLNVNGGDELSDKNITVTYEGTYGYIPDPSRTGYTFIGWYTENNEYVTSETTVTDACHCTLHAEWIPNNYTIIFVVNGENELPDDKKNTTVTYDATYDSLPTPTREGYIFDGWFTENNEEITDGAKITITNNITLYARWTEVIASKTVTPSKYVEIVFEKKDLTDEEITNILKKFTDVAFTITKTEDDETGGIRVIIEFNDIEKAEEFVKVINESSDSEKKYMRSVSFNSGVDVSISTMVFPEILFGILI